MDQKIMYAFRGWIAFVAFMDLGVAFRSFIEKKCIIGEYSFTKTDGLIEQDDPTLPRVLGMYSVLKAVALIHCTVFIHYIPVISMGICSILLTVLMYLTEALYFQSATLNFYIVFPCVLNGLTMIGLCIVPKKYLNAPTVAEDENAELLRQATAFKKRKQPRKIS
uniref:Putative hth-type transcriptional regulator n=1 Tax=Panstrongylus lignarius TaxID=156445 RepID=A0A224XYK1_9HEMI